MLKRNTNSIKHTIVLLVVSAFLAGAARASAATQSIYDEHADARHDIAAAVAQASKNGRNIVLIFGANW